MNSTESSLDARIHMQEQPYGEQKVTIRNKVCFLII